jgi:hypothetical protein
MLIPNGLIAFKELDRSRGGTWLWVCLHKAPLQQLLGALGA